MSAFTVSPEHIDALLTAAVAWSERCRIEWVKPNSPRDDFDGLSHVGLPWRQFNFCHADQIGQMLVDENYRSVNHRYREQDEAYHYEFRMLSGKPDPKIVLQAIRCFQYQACECPDFEQTEAFAFTEMLKNHALSELLRDVPGWSINSRDVFKVAEMAA